MIVKWSKKLKLKDLPDQIRNHQRYVSKNWWFDKAKTTKDGRFIGIWFEDGAFDVWNHDDSGWIVIQFEGPRV